MASAGGRWRRRWLRAFPLALALLPSPVRAEEAPLAIPDVPYVPQSEALCGGAALAMVLRYWGTPDVKAEDFASLLAADGRGITTDVLTQAALARGAEAHALALTPEAAAGHLAKGRPLIALIATRAGGHHYVVVLAWANGRVLFHDPAVAPFRVMPEAEWLRAWAATGNWALLVLPGAGAPRSTETGAPPAEDGPCAALVAPAVARARAGETEVAQAQLEAAAAWCPGASAPLRELASLAFRRQDWEGTQDLAARAVGVDPSDAFAWRLLATGRFLDGRREDALLAWNHVGEPHVQSLTIDGLDRTPFLGVSRYLGEGDGGVLTPQRLRRAQRRLVLLPAAQTSRVGYRPLPEGKARLEAAIVERPAFTPLPTLLLQSAARAVSDHTFGADALAVARSGDTLRAAGFWHPHRLRGTLAASGVRALGLPGIVTAEATWDEQSYQLEAAAPIVRERRRRGALSVSDWWGADTRGRVSVAADEYQGRGTYASAAADVDRRLLRDHLAIGGDAAAWWGRTPFRRASLRAAVRTRTAPDVRVLRVSAEYALVAGDAPLALWPGAGTGPGRGALLRAHPLLDDGVIDGAAFGRRLLSGTAEGEMPFARVGPMRLRAALFLDYATLADPRRTFVDLGAGLRFRPPGGASSFRVDLAAPTRGHGLRLSAGWQAAWPQ